MTTRGKLPEKIQRLLVAPANVALHGSPSSGKSWIADRTIDRLNSDGSRVVRIDLSTVMSGRTVFTEIAEVFAVGKSRRKASEDESIHDAWKSARRLLRETDRHVVLVLDQFDRVLAFDDAQEFLLLLRELVHRPEALHCTTLLISRRSLQSIEVKVQGISTLASVCYTEYLGSLQAEDLSAIGPGSDGLTPEDEDACLKWSGGHPALAKYWLATRPDRGSDSASSLEQAKVGLRILDHLHELGLLDAAAQFVLGPIIKDTLFERQELELLGVIPPVNAPAQTYTLADQEVFRDALRHRTWSLDPWGTLGAAEVRLRGVIEVVLSDAYGENWVESVSKRSGAIAKATEEARTKMERDKRIFGRHATWLSYTYPGDLWSIIQSEWEHFTTVFRSRDKTHWRQVLTGLSQYRAPLAHGRPEVLGEAQRTQCRIFAEEVLASVDVFESSRLDAAEHSS